MPKPSLDNPIDCAISEYAYLKRPVHDVVIDYEYIAKYQLNLFEECVTPEKMKKIKTKLKYVSYFPKDPIHQNRLYIVTNVEEPQLVLFDVEECILDHIEDMTFENKVYDQLSLPPEYFSTLFIFKNGKTPYAVDLTSTQLSQLIRCFQASNELSNAHVRDSWYGYPRRQERKNA